MIRERCRDEIFLLGGCRRKSPEMLKKPVFRAYIRCWQKNRKKGEKFFVTKFAVLALILQKQVGQRF
jgi:hypothetical protein